eukprot:16165_1
MDYTKLLTVGYIKQIQKECKLLQLIPDEITSLIWDYFYKMSMYECEFVTDTDKVPFDQLIKTVQLGQRRVGKSCFLTRFVDDKFDDSYIWSIGVDFKITTIRFENKIIKLQLWDEPVGKERFRTITYSYYRGAHGIFVLFDVTSLESFKYVNEYLKDIVDNAKINETVPKLLIGNKCDLANERQVSIHEANEFANKWNMEYIETSCKTSYNVHHAFLVMVKKILMTQHNQVKPQQNKLKLPKKSDNCSIL